MAATMRVGATRPRTSRCYERGSAVRAGSLRPGKAAVAATAAAAGAATTGHRLGGAQQAGVGIGATSVAFHERRGLAVVACASSQAAGLRALSEDELTEALENAKKGLMTMRFSQAMRRPDFQWDVYKSKRKEVARILTIKREREIEAGVSRSESRQKARVNAKKTGLALRAQQQKRFQIPGKKGQAPNKRGRRKALLQSSSEGSDADE